MIHSTHHTDEREPAILLVPGLDNSGPLHWQSHWECEFTDSQRVDLGMWDNPNRNTWVNKLNLAIQRAGRPVILVAHSLGCHAIAWWAEYERPFYGHPVAGALLVAPPEVEGGAIDKRLTRFAPVPPGRLPFPSILAASCNDPYIDFGRAKRLARIWGSRLVDAGPIGHINADSAIADWNYGKYLLRHLIASITPSRAPIIRGRAYDTLAPDAAPQLALGR